MFDPNFKTFHEILFIVMLLPCLNLQIGVYWVQASVLSLRMRTHEKGHNQATNTGKKPQHIFSGKFVIYCPILHIKHQFNITTSVDISPFAKCDII